MTIQTDQRTDVLIGQVQGCPVLASYTDDGKLYSAEMTWQGAKVITDADGFIELFGGRDIGITDWRIVRDLVQCDVIEDLTALVLAHQWIAPIDGYVPDDEIADDMPVVPVRSDPDYAAKVESGRRVGHVLADLTLIIDRIVPDLWEPLIALSPADQESLIITIAHLIVLKREEPSE